MGKVNVTIRHLDHDGERWVSLDDLLIAMEAVQHVRELLHRGEPDPAITGMLRGLQSIGRR